MMNNVEKNQVIGFVLLLLLFVTYFFLTDKKVPPKDPDTEPEVSDSSTKSVGEGAARGLGEPAGGTDSLLLTADSVPAAESWGLLRLPAPRQEEYITIENEHLRIVFSSKGGSIREVLLKNNKTHDQKDLYLWHPEQTEQDVSFRHRGKQFTLSQLHFAPQVDKISVSGADSVQLHFDIRRTDGLLIRRSYTLWGERYELRHTMTGLPADEAAQWSCKQKVVLAEKDRNEMLIKTQINYFNASSAEVESLEGDKKEEQISQLPELLSWVALKQKFFSFGLLPTRPVQALHLSMAPLLSPHYIKRAEMRLRLTPDEQGNYAYNYFFGPNSLEVLSAVSAPDFDENVYLGWGFLAGINKVLIVPIFKFLQRSVSSYGLLIVLLVLVVRLLLSPLTYRSYIGMAKMRVLKPEMDKIKEQNPDDTKKQQQELMKMYQNVGVNPLSGCLPMLLQMPILLSMFYFFPNMFAFRQKGFLWAQDLSSYDSVLNLPFDIPLYGNHVSLFTLLMTLSTLLYTWYNGQLNTTTPQHLKVVQYVMPFTFLLFLNSYSSGLTFYYFVSNVFSIGQQLLIKRFVDDVKIRSKLDAFKAKKDGKKETRFQKRIRAMQRGQ